MTTKDIKVTMDRVQRTKKRYDTGVSENLDVFYTRVKPSLTPEQIEVRLYETFD